MESENLNSQSLIEKISSYLKEKKKIFLLIFTILFLSFCILVYYNFYQEKKNIEISEKYIKAGLLLKNKNKKESLNLYKEIIVSKNKFYSLLSLSSIIENNIEIDNNEILKLFKILEEVNYNKDHKNLVKLKKALFLKKLNKQSESNKLLDEIISNDSIWKEIAIEIKK